MNYINTITYEDDPTDFSAYGIKYKIVTMESEDYIVLNIFHFNNKIFFFISIILNFYRLQTKSVTDSQ